MVMVFKWVEVLYQLWEHGYWMLLDVTAVFIDVFLVCWMTAVQYSTPRSAKCLGIRKTCATMPCRECLT